MDIERLWHTLRWLKPAQLFAQIGHRVGGRFERVAAFARRPVPAFPGVDWRPTGEWLEPGAGRNPTDALLRGEFVFLNRSEQLGLPPRDWEPREPARLWVYNLHYFEWLWALPFERGAAIARDWIARHDLARGRTGWEPYPVSLRLETWCAYFFDRHREETLADGALCSELWESIHRQAEWLAAHLETHLLGNHLFENAGALAFAGACFSGPAADRWRRLGCDLLEQELAEQILPDGGHFERSPLYQARIAWVLRALAWTGHADLEARVSAPLARSREALAHLVHPDGEIALLNDSAIGIANPPAAIGSAEPPAAVFALPDTGYFGARSAARHYVVCDAAPVGPDYIPGHAHGDMLSFELSLSGQRVFVDTGVFDYEPGEPSSRYRSRHR